MGFCNGNRNVNAGLVEFNVHLSVMLLHLCTAAAKASQSRFVANAAAEATHPDAITFSITRLPGSIQTTAIVRTAVPKMSMTPVQAAWQRYLRSV